MSTTPAGNYVFTESDAQEALQRIAKEKGKDRAVLLEKMLRHETSHFTSKQYLATGSAGMEDGAWGKVVRPYFPNGYRTVFFKDNHPEARGTSKPLPFIVWNSVYNFCRFLSDYIDRYGGNYARWNSTSTARQATYRQLVNAVRSRFNLQDAVKAVMKSIEDLPETKKKL